MTILSVKPPFTVSDTPTPCNSFFAERPAKAPFLDTFTPEWRPDTFNTHPIDSEQSIYRQDPSDEVDAAWERISKIGVLAISSEDVRRLGKDPSTVIQAPESWNLGSDAHLAHLDGLHLLHCLDAMRKSLHENFDRYYPNGTPAVHHTHLSHCQEALAKHLMCQPSVELITYSWVQEREHPFPDFDITKKCYGVDQLLDWQNEHQVEGMDRARWNTLRQPEDITPLVPPVLALEALNETRAKEELLR